MHKHLGGIEGLTVCLIDSGQRRHVSAVYVMNGDSGGVWPQFDKLLNDNLHFLIQFLYLVLFSKFNLPAPAQFLISNTYYMGGKKSIKYTIAAATVLSNHAPLWWKPVVV